MQFRLSPVHPLKTGAGFGVYDAVAEEEHPLLSLTVQVYEPATETDAQESVEVNPPGPDHEYV